jgi:hypothetical protein
LYDCLVTFLHPENFAQVKDDNIILCVQYTADPPQTNFRLNFASVYVYDLQEQYLCNFKYPILESYAGH